ncbi:MAG: HipA family kinase [Cyanobacteria bacterium J06607_13]
MNADVNQTGQGKEYQKAIARACSKREDFIQARTFLRGFSTKAQPVLMKCADGQNYMVKGQQAGRQIVNDQIVARLGIFLGAPVGRPKLIDIPEELIGIEPKLSHISAGVAHGTLFIPNCIDQIELIATSEPGNRTRLAHLAVVYRMD